ncbi:conserved hypothetical protein, partial [Bordetella bronchiseptica MO211]
MLRARSDAEVR